MAIALTIFWGPKTTFAETTLVARKAVYCASLLTYQDLAYMQTGKSPGPILERMVQMRIAAGMPKALAYMHVHSSLSDEDIARDRDDGFLIDSTDYWQHLEGRVDIEDFIQGVEASSETLERRMNQADAAPRPFWTRARLRRANWRSLMNLARAAWHRPTQNRLQNSEPDRATEFLVKLGLLQWSLAENVPTVSDDLGLTFLATEGLVSLLLAPPLADARAVELENYRRLFETELGRSLRGEFTLKKSRLVTLDFKYLFDSVEHVPHLLIRTRITRDITTFAPRSPRKGRPRAWDERLGSMVPQH